MTQQKQILVTKRNGQKELLDLDKIHKVIQWSCEGLHNVSVSDVEMNSKIQFYNDIKTETIHNTMVRAAADLISEDTPNYQYVAARLMLFNLRKIVLGQYEPIPVLDLVKLNIDYGVYNPEILEWYDDHEWVQLDYIVKHERDLHIAYAGMKQLEGKYLIQDRRTRQIYETPQYAYIIIAATVFSRYPKETRMKYVKSFYDNISKFNISLPTPIMAGVRTLQKQYSSCVLIECGDSIDSIAATTGAIIRYISQKAGIGIGASRIRAENSRIGQGQAVHTGVIPFYKLFQAAVKSCSQGGVRGGAATLYTQIWHLEIEDILVLRNNKGTEDNRVRRIDYGIQFNGFILERYLQKGKITLFSPHDVPDLHDAFYNDQNKFKELYLKYEKDPNITKRKVDAQELINSFTIERFETGRVYFMFVDHANTHSSFLEAVAPIHMSNLCCEITLPAKPLEHLYDEEGQISLCILSALNLGNIKDLSDLEEWADIAVRTLDELIDLQQYPLPAARITTQKRRSLGVGVINLAYYLAKHGVKYSDGSALPLVNRTFEAISYYLIKASVQLAKEKGPCDWFHETKYSKGILPIDTYKKDVDTLVSPDLVYDWEALRADVLQYGMRNSTLMALMPSETSSQLSNGTNGIEPIRSLVVTKGSKQSQAKQVVPEITKLKNKYELAWDMPSNMGYLQLVGVMSKYVDQAISTNMYYNPAHYPDGKVPMEILIRDFLTSYKYGIKCGYYSNTLDGRGDDEDNGSSGCESGACAI